MATTLRGCVWPALTSAKMSNTGQNSSCLIQAIVLSCFSPLNWSQGGILILHFNGNLPKSGCQIPTQFSRKMCKSVILFPVCFSCQSKTSVGQCTIGLALKVSTETQMNFFSRVCKGQKHWKKQQLQTRADYNICIHQVMLNGCRLQNCHPCK